MAEFYFPTRRLAYHVDGTRVFYRRREYAAFPNTYIVHTDYTEVPEEGRNHLNLERRGSLAFGQDGAGNMNGAFPHFGAWEIIFFFAQPMDLSGIYFSSLRTSLHSTVVGPSLMVEEPLLSVSKNTTAIDDGVWSDGLPLIQSTTRFYSDTTELGFSSPKNRRFFVWDFEDSVAEGQVFIQRGIDTAGTYRGTYETEGYGIQTLYGDYRGVRALRLTMPDQTDAGGTRPAAFGSRTNIHLYGTPTDEPVSWGVDIVNEDSSELDANDLHFGNLLLDWDGIITYYMPPFRVRNYSATQTAEDVTLIVTQPIDQKWYTSGTWQPWATVMNYVEARIGGGAWQDSSAVTTDQITLTLPDLSPGEESDVIEVRMRTPELIIGEWELQGPGNLQLWPQVGAWS